MRIIERIKEAIRQKACGHKEFEQDIQIRNLRCKSCGKRSRLSDYVDLYKTKKA
jgi:DNA-directed RNA polymerase subunit RPC12/RpoP